MKKLTFLLFISFIGTSCVKDRLITLQEKSFESTTFGPCVGQTCPNFNIHFLEASSSTENAQLFNAEISNEIVQLLLSFQEDFSPASTTIEEAILVFIDDYRKYQRDLGSLSFSYEADTYMEIIYQSNDLISIDLNFYLFTGGAHGYGGTRFLNFDRSTGKQFSMEELFTDIKPLEEIAEKMIREQYQIPADQNINATGLWFENDQFHLPKNIGFTENEILLVYNQYEIASYAEGSISLSVPKSDLMPYIKFP